MPHKQLKILISPLNWGLGHASRDIPVINSLMELGHEVYIGGSGDSVEFLKDYYPESMFVFIKSPKIKYGKHVAIGPGFAVSLVGFLKSIYHDFFSLKRIIKTNNFDVVISDNRPGLFSRKIKSLYITHQVNVKTRKPNSFSGKLVMAFHRKFVDKFDYCLIPDNVGVNSLAGELAEVLPLSNFKHTGVLSRFNSFVGQEYNNDIVDSSYILVLISGPEPHRSIFEKLIFEKFKYSNDKVIVVRGIVKNKTGDLECNSNLVLFDNPSDSILFDLIKKASLIICRSGYSTLMDLAVCSRKAILVPTPGQPEQVYLAEYFKSKFDFQYANQNDILSLNLSNFDKYNNWNYPFEHDKLKKVLALCID